MMKKKLRFSVLLLALLLVLTACSGTGPSVPFDDGDCRHIYGEWYDIEALSCLDAGRQIRYCKFCHAEQEQTVQVADDINSRKHDFTDTVVPPSESAGGYTTRVCELCGHRVEMAAPTPPLYELLSGDTTKTDLPTGLGGILLCNTTDRHLAYYSGACSVNAELARRLSVALVVSDALAAEGTTLTASSVMSVSADLLAAIPVGAPTKPGVFYQGASVSLEQTLGLWLSEGCADAGLMLAGFLRLTPAALVTQANARVARLLVNDISFTDLTATADFGTASLYGTAVLLCRALAEPQLAALLARDAAASYVTLAGRTPAVWFASATLRVSAVREGNTTYFLLLCGDGIATGLENGYYNEVLV
ncbi:MAG: hypothetical protein IKD28_01270 [Clostridia bacterium]|nr:hypothetical protein [Clostridia bacterium]